jgi:hypothetical protein
MTTKSSEGLVLELSWWSSSTSYNEPLAFDILVIQQLPEMRDQVVLSMPLDPFIRTSSRCQGSGVLSRRLIELPTDHSPLSGGTRYIANTNPTANLLTFT